MLAKTSRQYGLMQSACHGNVKDGPSKKVACEFIHATPKKKRKSFSEALSARRKRRE